MRYFIIGADGKKYGPADPETIRRWVAENRLRSTSMVEEEGTGQVVSARDAIVGLSPAVTAQAPYQPQAPAGSPAQSAHTAQPQVSAGSFNTVQPAAPYSAPDPGYAPQQPREPHLDNTSGEGAFAVVPPEVQRWNGGWNGGAFVLTWLWAIANNTWIGLLALIPCVGLIMCFVLGFKGNEWAWQNRRWDSIEHFCHVQRIWRNWGWGFLALILIPLLVLAIAANISTMP